MARQQGDPRGRRYPEIEQPGPGRAGTQPVDIFGDEDETMPLRGGDLGADHPASLGTAPQGGRDAGDGERYDSEDAGEGFGGGRGRLLAGAGRGQPPRYVSPERFDRAREHSASRMQRDRDEDRYGYPEATSYGREMSRAGSGYEPQDSFATQRESGSGDLRSGRADDRGERSTDARRGRSSGSGRYARQGPKGYARTDDRIHDDVCERLWFADDVDVADVSVRVHDRVVTLEGTVPERWMKYRIEDLCDDAACVSDVDNRIRIRRADTH